MSASMLSRRSLLSLRAWAARGTAALPAGDPDPFSSYTVACAQVNEARPFMIEEARRHGIATANRTDLDIVRDIFARTHPPDA